VDERTIDLTDSKGKHRAEDTLPGGFIPSHLAAPMLRGSAATSLEYAATELGGIRLAADVLADPHGGLPGGDLAAAREIAETATRLQRLLRALAAGALAALVLTVGLAAGPSQRAEAAEAPQPDPVAVRTVPVMLGAAPVTVYVRASVYTPTARGWWCASVWTARGRIGGTCSISASFPVPVTIDPRTFPVGRTFAQVVDDATDVAVSNVTLDARRPSRFGRGTWTPTYYGDGLTVTAPLYAYTPALGRWTPQNASPVQVQERINGRWVVRATLTTNRAGIAAGSVILGGGLHTVRVARVSGRTVWSTVGTARTFYLVPTDVPVDVD
jgi:hypothetical protein